MDIYSFCRLAQMEHEQRVHSLPCVPEYGYQVLGNKGQRQQPWAIRQLRPVIAAIVSILTK